MSEEKKPFIIVAEDDRFYGNIYRARLAKEGFEVELAINGEEALKAIRARRPDVLVLDLIMPVKDGFGVLKELHEDAKLKDLKVIVASNLGQDEDHDRAMKLGASDFMVKTNVSVNDMVDRIRRLL